MIYSNDWDYQQRTVKCECLLDGKVVEYDGCSSGTLEDAKAYYNSDKWEYMGSGYTSFYNGVKNVHTVEHHYFKYT